MMKKLLIISIDNNRYGIWKDDVLSVKETGTVYRLPESPDWFAGISRINDRTAHLIDIGVLLGHRPFDRDRRGCVLVMSDDGSLEGFVADSEEARIDVPDGSTFPMPAYMVCNGIDTFVLHGSELVPIIKIRDVYNQLRSECVPPPAFSMDVSTLPVKKEEKSHDFWMFKIDGENYAVRGDLIERSDVFDRRMSYLPSTPDHVEGVVYDSGNVRAILNPGKRIGCRYSSDEGIVMFVKDGGPGLMVGSDVRTFAGSTPAVLPPLASSELMQFALIDGNDIIPVLNIHALISVDPKYRKRKYAPRSRFHRLFGTQEVKVLEFALSDMVLSLPDSQVEDIIDVIPFRTIRGMHPLLLGVAELKGDLLPVLSLTPCFGKTARPAGDSMMIMIRNGNFRALVLAEKVLNRKSLLPGDQKDLPINLLHRYVYGCYTDEKSVRLILDVATIAMYAGEGKVSDDLMTLMERIEPRVLREAEEQVAISKDDTEPDSNETIDHEKADPPVHEETSIDVNQADSIEERVFAQPLLDAASAMQEPEGDTEYASGPMYEDLTESPRPEPTEGDDDLGGHHVSREPHDHGAILNSDISEKEDTGRQVTEPDATEDGIDRGPVYDERKKEEISECSQGTTSRRDEDVAEADRTHHITGKEEGERGHRGITDKTERKVTMDHHNEAGNEDSKNIDLLKRDAVEKKETGDGSSISSYAGFPENKDGDDISPHELAEDSGSLCGIEEAVPPDKTCYKAEMHDAGHQTVKSGTSKRRRGLYAFLALGILALLIVCLSYVLRATSNHDLTANSESSSTEGNVLEETVPDVNKPETDLPSATSISDDENMDPLSIETLQSVSVPDKPITASDQPALDGDKKIPAAAIDGKINDSSVPGTVHKNVTHVVKKGDTLWDISEHFTGNPFNYHTIAAENEITNPDLIFPGQRIVIHIKESSE